MLPTKGYFQDIECPFYDSTCNRPYCHFRHRSRKSQEPPEENLPEPQKEEVPTYKPTPKSELAKSHIPISYVPDLAFTSSRPNRPLPKFTFEKPTYNPTPLSILSSANKPEGELEDKDNKYNNDIEAIKKNLANSAYNPVISLQGDINFEDLSAEFDLIDEIIEEPPPKNKDKSQEKTEDKKKSKSSHSKSHKSKHHKSESKDKSKEEKHDRHSSKSKDKKKDKSEHKSSSRHKSSRDKHRSRDKSDDKKSSKRKEKTKEVIASKEKEKKISSDDDDTQDFQNDVIFDEEFDDEDETLLECYKIFNEYKPPSLKEEEEKAAIVIPVKEDGDETIIVTKKRVAHAVGSNNPITRPEIPKPKVVQNPGQVLANRFKLARRSQGENEQKNIMNEIRQAPVKRPIPSLLEAARELKKRKLATTAKSSDNLVDSIINGARTRPKKIAPVPNVLSIQRAKTRIEEMAKNKAAESLLKTPAQSTKGVKRVAHVPDFSLSDIPDVLHIDKSKLPVNVRTRFLIPIADECVKLYLTKEDAYTRALNEEFTCYEKCKVLITYKNSAMLAVNRLRNELKEREKLGLGPIGSGEAPAKDKSSEIAGRNFYENIKQYILSDEELDIHGYPKECHIPGHAVIKNLKNKPRLSLEPNQRKCARCHKIYLVDDDGVVLYEEECVYHSLKKRTLRGEQIYLCCKSNVDTGCATSHTHVSEAVYEAELEGYQTTMDPEREDDSRSYAVYALDCEMCYTTKGLELTRVTIVDPECKTVYDSLVKPLNPIIDYNTTFSGITKEQMDRTSTSILQVQANILHLCNSKTILIGHSLESDMKALKIIHGTVVDTSVLFPHKMGLPHKRALRVLASEYLKKIIQNNVSGHDSSEDAITCMELLKWKVKDEFKARGVKIK